ncbi:MAG: condensation domain-containing protein, partial [Blastocatellia bacterium]
AYVAYTSGSTGQPKGILSCHGGVVNYLRYVIETYCLNSSDIVLQVASFTFDASVRDSIGPLMAGARVIIPNDEEAPNPATLLELISRHKVTRLLSVVPTTLRSLIGAAAEYGLTCSSVRTILVSGEPLYLDDCRRARSAFGEAPLIVNQYGPTECTMTSTYHPVSDDDGEVGAVPIGKPIPNSRLCVLSSAADLAAPGITGEVYIGGAGLARGYLNRADLTAERFRPDPFGTAAGARVYATGDLARYTAGGNIDLAGRRDHQVKIRGVRVELAEIEAAVGQHAAIRETAVVAREDGSREKTLTAYYTSNNPSPSPADLREFLRGHLPEYLVPSILIEIGAMPLTRNGKVDRRALVEDDFVQAARPTYLAPRSPVEKRMARIWAEMLGVDKVGVYDNFFDLGGHSLRAASLVYRVLRVFQVEIALRSIFDFPALGDFCNHLLISEAEGGQSEKPHLELISRRTTNHRLPLSFAQHRLWFFDQLEPGSAAYNLPVLVRLRGVLEPSALAQSLVEIVRRHESLRTRFPAIEGEPIQVVEADLTVDYIITDMRTLAAEKRESSAIHLARENAARSFDLATGPLFMGRLYSIGETDHLLMVAMHHIVADLWSIGILVKELAALYTSFRHGEPSPLPDPPIQYADFALWQSEWMRGEVLEYHLAYWRQQLDALQPMHLPADRPRPATQSYQGAREAVALRAANVDRLNALCREEGATLYMVLLAAFQVLIYRYTGREDIAVGSPTANRNRGQVEDVVGCFANSLVLRTSLAGNRTFRELLQRVKSVALDAYTHQDVPFEKLVEAIDPERDLSQNALFQVLFALQNVPIEPITLPGLELQPVNISGHTARFDLALWLIESPAGPGPVGLGGSIEYRTDLFDAETIVALIERFQVVTESIASDPDQKIASLPLLTEAERKLLLFEWNPAPRQTPPVRSITQMFQTVAEQFADSSAVVCEGRALTFRELNERSDQLANHLMRLDIGPCFTAGICLHRSIELIVAMLGVIKAGGAYVPLDPTNPVQRLAHLIADSQAGVVLTGEGTAAGLPWTGTRMVSLEMDSTEIARNDLFRNAPSV